MINLIDQYDLRNLVVSYSTSYDKYKINFSLVDSPQNPYLELSDTTAVLVSCTVEVIDNESGEQIILPVPLMNVPVRSSMGLKIDGTNYELCSLNQRASGWYHSLKKDGKNRFSPLLELIPKHGRQLKFLCKNNIIEVKLGSKAKTNVNLGVFLKAMTGYSYRQLLKNIGIRNKFVANSLVNELSYDDSIDEVLSVILPKTVDNDGYTAIPKENRERELHNFLGSKFLKLDELSRDRYNVNSSFYNRALGLELAKPVLNYKIGTVLTANILEEIDSSDVDSLFVIKNKVMYELKKYKAEGVDLCINEILTEVNMFANNLDGFDLYDEPFDEKNRSILSLKEAVRKEISDKLISILDYIRGFLLERSVSLRNLSLENAVSKDLDEFINNCKQGFNHSQGAETVNLVSFMAKESKVVMDYGGRTNDKIISLKPSHQSTYDHFNIPESDKIGVVAHMNVLNYVAKDGMIYAPYLKVVNGVVSDEEPIQLNPRQREGKYIAPWDEDLSNEYVKCYYDGRVLTVPREQIEYQEFSVMQTLSLPTSLIAMLQFSEGKRITMGCNQNKQALPCLMSEAPLVSTGALCLVDKSKNILLRAVDILSDMYFNNSLEGIIDYEDFLKSSVKLDTLDNSQIGYRSYLFIAEYKGTTYEHSVVLPFFKKGTENSVFHYHLNYKKDHVYSGRDIVLYNNSVDIKAYNKDYYVNLGAHKVDNEIFDFDSAIGVNLNVAFKSFGIPNMDDGLVLCDSILGTGKLAHCRLIEFKTELKNFKEGSRERFGISSETSTHNKDGLPKIGTYLKPKSNVIGITVTKRGINHERYEALNDDQEGEVIFAQIHGDKAYVYLASVAEIELGDKLSGDHGNKGVIGRIVPKKDMPYLGDGKIMDLCVNPLGIPSRMNISQLIVAFLAYAAKAQGKRIIVSPANPDSYDIANDYFRQIDVSPKQLYDGRTGRPFTRKTSVGILYFKKLFHTTKSKMNSCGMPSSFNPITGQPNKGKSVSGGQKIGEMETWALDGAGAPNFLQELFSVKSDDSYGRKRLEKCLEDGTEFRNDVGSNNNMYMFQTEIRLMGYEMELIDGKYQYRPLLDKDIRGFHSRPSKYTKDSLQDDSVFGPSIGPDNIDSSKKNWSYVDLNCEIIHPIWIYKSFIPSLIPAFEAVDSNGEIIYKPTLLGKEKLIKIIEGKLYCEIVDGEIRISKVASNLDLPKYGIEMVVAIFKSVDFKQLSQNIDKAITKVREGSSSNKEDQIFKLVTRRNSLEYLISLGINGKDLVWSSFPIMPRNFRYNMEGRVSNFDMYYRRILSAATPSSTLDANKVYDAVLRFIGLDNSKKLASDADSKNMLEYFTGKGSDNKSHGIVRDSILSKVCSFSGRSTIIPGRVKLGTVGVPRNACYNYLKIELPHLFKTRISCFEYYDSDFTPLINSLSIADLEGAKAFLKKNFDLESDEAIKVINKCDDLVREVLSKRAVAFGRQPTLQVKSIRGLTPVMTAGNALEVHPLLCAEYNADFDGDQMWNAMAHDPASIQELLTNCNPITGFYSDKDGGVSLLPTQDLLLGLYLATMLHDNVLHISDSDKYDPSDIVYYDSVHAIKNDLASGYVHYSDLACLTINGDSYLSTVGRILLNSIVPSGFTKEVSDNPLNIPFINPANYKKLKYDGLVRKGGGSKTFTKDGNSYVYPYVSVSTIIKESIRELEPKDGLTFLDSIVEFGEESCIVSGITLHLDDFIEDDLKDKYIEVYKKFVEESNQLFDLGLITEEDRKNNALKASNYISKMVKANLMNCYPRNNNLFIIIDSGSRGNESQLMRSCGFIGTINKSNTEQIETPILRSFRNGLKSSDIFIMAHGTRHGVSTVQKDTGKVGEMTRALVFGISGLTISEGDCGCGFKDLNVMYDEFITDMKLVLNKRLHPSSAVYKETINITKQGLITLDVINYVNKHKIRELVLDDSSVFKIEYKLSALFRSMMFNKLATDLPYLDRDSVITKQTLDYIEQEQLEVIKARTIITCECKTGICARCYGILYNSNNLPSVGYRAGIIAGQSIGEPATQLNLDTINAAGSGNSSASSVNLFKSMTLGSIPEAFKRSLVAKEEGFVDIKESGDNYIINLSDKLHKIPRSEVTVIAGERVVVGQEITKGVLDVKDIPETLPNYIEERMFRQLMTYFNIFHGSGVSIDARHFEVLVRAQLSFVFINDSDDELLPSGSIQPLYSVIESQNKGNHVEFFNRPLNRLEQIITISGPTSAICHHDPAKTMSVVGVCKELQNNKTSLIDKLVTGTNLVTDKKAKPLVPKYKDLVESKEESPSEVAVEQDIDLFKVQDMQESVVPESLNLDDLFSGELDLFDSLDSSMDDLIDDTETNEVEVNESGLFNSNVFGGGSNPYNESSTETTVTLDNSNVSEKSTPSGLGGSSLFADLSLDSLLSEDDSDYAPDEEYIEEEGSDIEIDIDLD